MQSRIGRSNASMDGFKLWPAQQQRMRRCVQQCSSTHHHHQQQQQHRRVCCRASAPEVAAEAAPGGAAGPAAAAAARNGEAAAAEAAAAAQAAATAAATIAAAAAAADTLPPHAVATPRRRSSVRPRSPAPRHDNGNGRVSSSHQTNSSSDFVTADASSSNSSGSSARAQGGRAAARGSRPAAAAATPLREVEAFQRRLTRAIATAPTLAALRDIAGQYGACCNPVHASALMVRAAALVTAGNVGARDMLQLPLLLPALRELVLAQLPHYTERCVANTLHSAAALDALARDRELFSALGAAAALRAHEMTPQGLANVAWALARQPIPPPPKLAAVLADATAAAMGRFNEQELADVGHYWATTAMVAATATAAAPGHSFSLAQAGPAHQQQQQHQHQHQHQHQQQRAGGGSPAGGSLSPAPQAAQLSPAASAAWVDAWLAAVARHLPRASARALARLLWAAARMGAAPGDAWLAAAWAAVGKRLKSADARSTSAIVWAACRLWAPVGGLTMGQVAPLLARAQATLAAARADDVTAVLQALASAGALRLSASPAHAGGSGSSSGDDGSGGDGANDAGDEAAARAAMHALLARAGRLLPSMGARQVAQLLWASARLQLRPNQALVRRAAARLVFGGTDGGPLAVVASAAGAAPRAPDLAMGLWGAARHGLRAPPHWAGAVFAQAAALAPELAPAEVVALLGALAALRLAPPPAVLAALLGGPQRRAEQQLSAYGPRNLAMLAHALARLHRVHAVAWARREAARRSRSAAAAAGTALDDNDENGGEGEGEAAPPPPPPPPSSSPPSLPPPMAGAPRALRDELLHATFHRLSAMGGRDLSTLVWAAAELKLEPPPAWLYACVAACRAALPSMAAADIAVLARTLQRAAPGAGDLPRVREFLDVALLRLGELEQAGGAPSYTAGRLDALLAMAPPEAAGGAGASAGGFPSPSRMTTPPAATTSRKQVGRRRRQQQQQQQSKQRQPPQLGRGPSSLRSSSPNEPSDGGAATTTSSSSSSSSAGALAASC